MVLLQLGKAQMSADETSLQQQQQQQSFHAAAHVAEGKVRLAGAESEIAQHR
jgi:hypothetical protein